MNQARTRLAGLGGALLAGLAGLWWLAHHDHGINFLAQRAPASWILYETPPDTEMHPAVPLWTEFRREFVLPTTVNATTLELRAFKTFEVSVNGQALTNRNGDAANWKQATSIELTALLKPGTNWLSVIVTNHNGPPALWAVLRSGGVTLKTDAAWSASLVGAIWQPAASAGQKRQPKAGHQLDGAETVTSSFQHVRWWWLAILSGSGIAWVVWKTYLQRTQWVIRFLASPRAGWSGVGLIAICWLILFTNNLPRLPSLFGFDTDGHTEYIRYVQEQGRLPLANEGWQMYQPPLYYLLSTGVLELTGHSMDATATGPLRALSGIIGFTHLIVLWLSLRRIFPGQRSAPMLGLLFAASLPALLCVSQFITNEGLAALCTTTTLYFTLRLLQHEAPPAWLWSATGGSLGLALLSKFSAVVLLPFVAGLLVWHASKIKFSSGLARCRGPGLALAAGILVCGWHYGRVWAHFGNPLIGNWSPESGFAWWQENGFTTATYFSSFGHALATPLFSGFDSLGDGLFSTLWADGLCSGGTRMTFRPPWNYSWMVAGLGLALVPTMLAVVGAIKLSARWVRQATLQNLLWPAVLVAYGLAIAAMTLRVPSYAQAKSVYALGALLPLCVCLLEGLEALRGAGRFMHRTGVVLMALWMINGGLSFWIRGGAAATHEILAANHLDLGRPAEALAEADQALQLAPDSVNAAVQRSAALRALGRSGEAQAQAEKIRAQHGLTPGAGFELATAAVAQGDREAAIALALEVAAKFPDDPQATHNAALWSLEAGHPEAAAELCRRALRIRFANPALHVILSKALAAQNQSAESLAHLRLAVRLKPDWPMTLNELAWKLATHPLAALRNGPEAVPLAEHACELTQRQQPQLIGTLAAAYAEAGRFDDAVRTAESAIAAASAAGLKEIVERNQFLLQLYRTRQPYHDPEPVESRAKN